jgi:hypothetical protein
MSMACISTRNRSRTGGIGPKRPAHAGAYLLLDPCQLLNLWRQFVVGRVGNRQHSVAR